MVASFSLADVILSMFVLFLLVAWIALVIYVFVDIFRSKDLSGWAKALWVLFVIILPWLGVLVYLIARGDKMTERQLEDAAERERLTRAYIQDAASSGSTAEEIEKLKALRDAGTISLEEYESLKAKALS